MSTRSRIAIQLKDGSVKSIYCHHDGDLDYVGMILFNYYKSYDKVLDLINLGNISSLGTEPSEAFDSTKTIKTSTYEINVKVRDYNRLGEGLKYNMPKVQTFKEFNKYCQKASDGVEYIYYFTPDRNGNYRWLYKELIYKRIENEYSYKDYYYMNKFKPLCERSINLELAFSYLYYYQLNSGILNQPYRYDKESIEKASNDLNEVIDELKKIFTDKQFNKVVNLYDNNIRKAREYVRGLV